MKRTSTSTPVGERSPKAAKHDDARPSDGESKATHDDTPSDTSNTTIVTAVGMRFRERQRDAPPHKFSASKTYDLLRDKDNAYDDNAVKLMHGEQHLAYLCREDAATWAPKLDAGVQLHVTFTDRWPQSVKFALVRVV